MRGLIIPFIPFVLIAALVAGWLGPRRRMTAGEVAQYLRDFINGTGGEWDWDDFESVPIADPALDSIRARAALAGPPDPDLTALRHLLAEAEALAGQEAEVR